MDVFNNINIKHFKLLKYIAQNSEDEHVMCKISCIIRSDRIDTPYYMDVKFALTYCTGIYNKGIIHAMDILKNQRMYNITEKTHDKVIESFLNNFKDDDEFITLRVEDKLKQISIQTKNTTELLNILDKYEEFFNNLDSLA